MKACAPKGRLPYKQRKKLPKKAFAQPSLRAFPLYKMGSDGKLLPSRNHAINAKARAQQAYNRGELSKATLKMIDRKADKVIKECDMAKAKKRTKKKSTKKVVRKTMISRSGRETKSGSIPRTKSDLAKADMTMLRSIDRQAKRGKPVLLKQYSSASSKNRIRTLEKGGFVAALPGVGKGYALTPKGASAIGNVYKSVAKIEKMVDGKVPSRRKKTTKKKATKKKATSKKRRSSARKEVDRKRRTVHARYDKGVKVKVSGSKKRVPVEVRDVPEVKNKVIILI